MKPHKQILSLFCQFLKSDPSCCVYLYHLLSVLSWLAEGRSCARLDSVLELCVGREEGKWDEGAGALLVLMLRDGDSGFGVEDADEAGMSGEKHIKSDASWSLF